ncbi:hypothetical protein EJ05DRAFT_498174 [Pseudovirgaria hyperparasitica]|uniref:Gfd2/YDR514C-like C-terminal domain-containing protein n=1 Tax=Pseudovirgaria hyperparasitica TaxID=470096 RepID=A0A6A6WEA2_9PEZI|nr:uncharacterized protein EJ05DRAFT_498174 [Pseudovirgaria hyperparasitica]KAF2760206.1 hypothetical protein EJ05DRAFT_498174 [Pseudovirgaria hyperparasitica]
MPSPRAILMQRIKELIMEDGGAANKSSKPIDSDITSCVKLASPSMDMDISATLKTDLPPPDSPSETVSPGQPSSHLVVDNLQPVSSISAVQILDDLVINKESPPTPPPSPKLYRPQEAKPTHSSPASLVDPGIQYLRSIFNLPTSTYDPVDPSAPIPQFINSTNAPILASIDCEAWEDDRRSVQEVGFALLDIRKLSGVAPGIAGREWMHLIEYHHYITEEYKHLVNKRQLKGCPDKFLFGQSKVVKKAEYNAVLSDLLTIEDDLVQSGGKKEKYRRIVLVGHSLADDVKYLGLCGFDVVAHIQSLLPDGHPSPTASQTSPKISISPTQDPTQKNKETPTPPPPYHRPQPTSYPIPTLDTHTLIQALSPPSSPDHPTQKLILSVGKLIYMFTPPSSPCKSQHLPPPHLHNAGNDAAYTLHALILLALRCGEQVDVPYWPYDLLTFVQRRRRDERYLQAVLEIKLGGAFWGVWRGFRGKIPLVNGEDGHGGGKREVVQGEVQIVRKEITEAQRERRRRGRRNAKENARKRRAEEDAKKCSGVGVGGGEGDEKYDSGVEIEG